MITELTKVLQLLRNFTHSSSPVKVDHFSIAELNLFWLSLSLVARLLSLRLIN